jgi:uncharacterized delta-60 repeat protein
MKAIVIILVLAFAGCSDIPGSSNQVVSPAFNLAPGIYGHRISVSISCSTPDALIRYTTDGSAPGDSSPLFSTPLTLSEVGAAYRITARAWRDGMSPSEPSSATYRIVRAGAEDTTYWDKLLDNAVGIGITVTPSGNICTVGYGAESVEAEAKDSIIRMFTADGDPLWAQTDLITSSTGKAVAVRADTTGNLYIAGTETNAVHGSSALDWSLRKLNAAGVEQWRLHRDGNSGNDYTNSIALDSTGAIYVAGSGYNLAGTGTKDDWCVRKFTTDGTEITSWYRHWDGNNGEDYINEVAIDSKDNIYLVGCGQNLVSSSSNNDWRIIKLAPNGIFFWERMFDGKGGNDYANAIAIDANDDIYVIGNGENIVSSNSLSDWWIMKINSHGTTLWQKTYDGNLGNDYLNAAAIDSKGYLYVAGAGYVLIDGSSNYDWWIEKLDCAGDHSTVSIYTKRFDGANDEDYANAIAIDSFDNLYVVGHGQYLNLGVKKFNWWIKKFYN